MLGDRGVEIGEAGEALVAQCREDLALYQEHTRLGLGLVAWLSRPCREHSHSVVMGEFPVCPVDCRLIQMCRCNCRPQVVRNHAGRCSSKEGQGTHVRVDPALQGLPPAGLGVEVRTGAQHGDEDLCIPGLLAGRTHPYGRAGVVHEHGFAGLVHPRHRHVVAPPPPLVEVAEVAEAVPVRVLGPVLLPHQAHRQVLVFLHLGVQRREVHGLPAVVGLRLRHLAEDRPLQLFLGDSVVQRPRQASPRCPPQDLVHSL